MRAEIEKKGGLIIKRVPAGKLLYEFVASEILDYCAWLSESGFEAPHTELEYDNGKMVFSQKFLPEGRTEDVGAILRILKKLDTAKYGIDSNPNNFVGKNTIHFVDLFPLPIKSDSALGWQFDYPVATVIRRYFTKVNILATFINRLFKIDAEGAKMALEQSAGTLVGDYDDMLEREKTRMLKAMTGVEGEEYKKYYEASKARQTIDDQENLALLKILKRISLR